MRTVAHAAIVVSIALLAGCDGDGVDGNPPDLNGWRELRIRDSGSTTDDHIEHGLAVHENSDVFLRGMPFHLEGNHLTGMLPQSVPISVHLWSLFRSC